MSDEKKRAAQEAAKDKFLTTFQPGQLADMMQDKPLWEIDPDCLNPFKELSPLQTWCKMGDRPALPKEGIVTISAKYKRGKSLSAYALAIPLISGNVFDTITPNLRPEDGKPDRPKLVMVFDMEMSETTLINRVLGQIHTLGDSKNRFAVFSLKAKSVEDRIKTIAEKILLYQPEIVIVDQAAKLVNNINDYAECDKIVNWLDTLSIGRSLWIIMHENKNSEDTNMTGHMGTCLQKANVEWYTVDKKDGVFTTTYKEGRDTDSEGAASVRFALNADGQIIDASSIYRKAQDQETEKWRNNFTALFGTDTTLRNVDIENRIKEKEGLEKRAAQNKITRAKELGVIRKTGTDKNAPYEITPFEA